MAFRAGILTVSDSRAAGTRADETTELIRVRLEGLGFEVVAERLIPDDRPEIEAALRAFADVERLGLVLATGGTGLSPRDVTPEATLAVIDREVPGLAEAMRAGTAAIQPLAWLSRAVAGQRGQTLIVNLPGSPKGVAECLDVLASLLPHALATAAGPHDHDHDQR